MKTAKIILKILKTGWFALLIMGFAFIVLSTAFDYGEYMLNREQVLAACKQCRNCCAQLGFFTSVAAGFIGILSYARPPKGVWFCFLVSFFGLIMLLAGMEIWGFSLHADWYRYPDEVIIYEERVRVFFIEFCWAAVCVLQVYLKPPLRKYVITANISIFLGRIVWAHLFA